MLTCLFIASLCIYRDLPWPQCGAFSLRMHLNASSKSELQFS